MIVLITGATHTGKTLLAQGLLEKYGYPYFSIDLLKMGLIRSGNTSLTPEDDRELEKYLWPILREMILTAVENGQNLIIEGGYIPFGWKEEFTKETLDRIRYYCLVMSQDYIEQNFKEIKRYANVVEQRGDDTWCTKHFLLKENAYYLKMCEKYSYEYLLIEDRYKVEVEITDLE